MPQPRFPTKRVVNSSSDVSVLFFLIGAESSSSALRFLDGSDLVSGFFSSSDSESSESSESSSESSESSESSSDFCNWG